MVIRNTDMKKFFMILFALFVCACSDVSSIKYENDGDGCTYTESYRPRKVFPFDWFGLRDNDVKIHYSGTKCDKMVDKDIKSNLDKKENSDNKSDKETKNTEK